MKIYKYIFLAAVYVFISFSVCLSADKNSGIEKDLLSRGLVNIQSLDPSIVVDLKYSTIDNFLNEDVYGDLNTCYLQKEAAEKLAKAQAILRKLRPGHSLIVYDGVRPRRIQHKMWEIVKGTDKQKYVANPVSGSIHNYGCAVDLSVVDENGRLLDMGTPFDFFGDLAQPRHEEKFLKEGKLSQAQIENRKLLRKVMDEAGFQGILSEWWHFNAFPKDYVEKNI